VPSPQPIDFIEIKAIKNLFDNNFIVIAGGGGGIPVYEDKTGYIGIDSVIDKDFTSAKLAELINADILVILTAVNNVKINFNKPNEKSLDSVDSQEILKYIKEKQFAPGSMLPKIQAALQFVNNTNKIAYIGNLEEALDIVKNKKGTKITK
jgi:carbamate kinase